MGHGQGVTQIIVAISAYPEYFQKRLGIVVGFAPIMKLDNCNIKFFKDHSESPKILQKIENLAPYDSPLAANFLLKHFWALFNCSDFSRINLGAHFPAGGSFKSIEHFR